MAQAWIQHTDPITKYTLFLIIYTILDSQSTDVYNILYYHTYLISMTGIK